MGGLYIMSVKKCLLTAVIACGAVVVMSENSEAFFGRRGSHGSCGSSGGGWGSGGSWGGSHGSWGSRGGWGSRGSHGGSWGGSHGSWGGSHGSHGGGYAVTHYGDGGYASRGVTYDRVVVRESKPVTIAKSLPAVKTRLTLRVPAEAKVTLAGVETKQTGEVRQFSTSKLSAGQVWEDYTVVVEMNRDGQVVREERTLKLTGGMPQELAIDFAENQLAQR
jgi:uncharacterized protein (TIGR03000 family)